MTYRVIPTTAADRELEDAYHYIASDNPAAAAKWYNGCLAAMRSLGEFPNRCPLAPENDEFAEEIRHLIFGNYRILFTICGDEVHVLHVRHGARKPIDPHDN